MHSLSVCQYNSNEPYSYNTIIFTDFTYTMTYISSVCVSMCACVKFSLKSISTFVGASEVVGMEYRVVDNDVIVMTHATPTPTRAAHTHTLTAK